VVAPRPVDREVDARSWGYARYSVPLLVLTGRPGGPGYKAQNNTQTIFADPDAVVRFQTELITEHMVAKSQQTGGGGARPAPAKR
jgi:hypothetical protein